MMNSSTMPDVQLLHLKGTVPREFLLQVFYMDQPLIIPLGRFNFFRKYAEIFAAQDAPPVSLTQVANGKNLKSETFSLFLLVLFG
jgi:hypothetical protein